MARGKRGNKQINQYDKILRENLEAALPGLIRNLLGIDAVYAEELPDDVQHTKERKPDVLIHSGPMSYQYELIALSAVDYHLLLNSDNPEEKILSILADFGGEDPRRTIETIVKQVISTSKGDFARLRRIRQLRILAQLRNLASGNLGIMDSIAQYISKEKDIFYQWGEMKGLEKGIEKGKETFVKNLLLRTDFTVAEIARLGDVSEAFVRKVKKNLN